jgi:hypothetical protein
MTYKIESNANQVLEMYAQNARVTTAALKKTYRQARKVMLDEAAKEIMKVRKLKKSELINKDQKKTFLYTLDKLKGKLHELSITLMVSSRSPSLLRFVRGNKEPRNQKGIKPSRRKKVIVEVTPGKRQKLDKGFIVKGKYNQKIVAQHARGAKWNPRKGGTRFIWGQRSGKGFWSFFNNDNFRKPIMDKIKEFVEKNLKTNWQAGFDKAALRAKALALKKVG